MLFLLTSHCKKQKKMADESKQTKTTRTKKNSTKTIDYGKVPPQAIELEEMVLGALMVQKDALSLVDEILKPEHFYKETHKEIYTAIVNLNNKQEPIDIFTVVEQLRKNGKLEEVGGPYYITTLTNKVGSAAHIEFHAKIIVQKYLARELIRVASTIETEVFIEENDVDDLMQKAEGMLFELSQQNIKKDVVQINPVIEEARERISKAAENKSGMSGVTSGFHVLDKVTSGWQKSDLIIIAARPAMGKTAFVLSMAKNIAVDRKVPVGVFSLEMSNVQLVNRLIVNVCSISGEKIKSGQLEQDEWRQLDTKIKDLYDAPLYLDDTAALSITQFQSKARRLVKNHGVKLIIIDYLQLMNASGLKFQSREQEISMISRSLKGLAKELDIPIIALSQLNRNVEGRTGNDAKVPQLSDLRESGAIEQDADIVCFIHRPEYYKITEIEGKDMHGVAQIIVAKHRNGATCTVNLKFKNEYARFMNEDDERYQTESVIIASNSNKKDFIDNIPLPPNSNEEVPF